MYSLNTENCHTANFVVTGGNADNHIYHNPKWARPCPHTGLLRIVWQGAARGASIQNVWDCGTPSLSTTPRTQHTHGCHKLTWQTESLYMQFKFELSLLCVGSRYSAKNDFWMKLVFTILLIPVDSTMLPMRRFLSRARVMVVPPFDHLWRH